MRQRKTNPRRYVFDSPESIVARGETSRSLHRGWVLKGIRGAMYVNGKRQQVFVDTERREVTKASAYNLLMAIKSPTDAAFFHAGYEAARADERRRRQRRKGRAA